MSTRPLPAAATTILCSLAFLPCSSMLEDSAGLKLPCRSRVYHQHARVSPNSALPIPWFRVRRCQKSGLPVPSRLTQRTTPCCKLKDPSSYPEGLAGSPRRVHDSRRCPFVGTLHKCSAQCAVDFCSASAFILEHADYRARLPTCACV